MLLFFEKEGLALLLRPSLQQRQILLRQIPGRRVRRQVGRALPIRAGAGQVAGALADDAAFQQQVGAVGVQQGGGADVGAGGVDTAEVAPGGGAQDQGVGAFGVEVERAGEVVGGFGVMRWRARAAMAWPIRSSGSSGERASARLAES